MILIRIVIAIVLAFLLMSCNWNKKIDPVAQECVGCATAEDVKLNEKLPEPLDLSKYKKMKIEGDVELYHELLTVVEARIKTLTAIIMSYQDFYEPKEPKKSDLESPENQ